MSRIRQLASTLCMVMIIQSPSAIAFFAAPKAIAQTHISPVTSSTSDAIRQVVSAGLMKNYADGQFHPERFINRAELASILVNAFALDTRAAATQENLVEVQDVPASHWAFNNIQTVLKTGIMRGYRGNMFFPNQRVNRAEAFAIFAQAYGVYQFPDDTVAEILTPYPDAASVPTWARRSIATALNEGFVNTDPQGNIRPLQPVTRGDMAYALSRYLVRQQQPGV
ncbi:S-layer homology domain-containing protein [Chroogloeocystis siderophila]|uniref:SLH domain-containing protein n=1 Tax=Chroogloeocystis siderophila 5.2 s.c.1 TaxID=247279 RepID=A0A1U7HCV6_9CHRO|nr:S-layer homology domain-containing protein [Chroogloeocystis siderophila]OKH21375.1 hypothetical protein NIES1031_21805 [Chroogloeocystis siderophila 5.2 s.c.1]